MLRLAQAFLALALIAGLLGFDLVGDLPLDGARVVCVVCLLAAAVLFVGNELDPRPAEPLQPDG